MYSHKGIPVLSAQEYRTIVSTKPSCIILLITPSPTQLKMLHVLHGVLGDYYRCAIPVRDEDAHLVRALRIPRVRVFVNSKLRHDIILDMHDSASLENRLRDIGLMK